MGNKPPEHDRAVLLGDAATLRECAGRLEALTRCLPRPAEVRPGGVRAAEVSAAWGRAAEVKPAGVKPGEVRAAGVRAGGVRGDADDAAEVAAVGRASATGGGADANVVGGVAGNVADAVDADDAAADWRAFADDVDDAVVDWGELLGGLARRCRVAAGDLEAAAGLGRTPNQSNSASVGR